VGKSERRRERECVSVCGRVRVRREEEEREGYRAKESERVREGID